MAQRGPHSSDTQMKMSVAQRRRREREAAGIPVGGEKLAAIMVRNGIATGHGDTLDDLLGELEAWLKRFRSDRDDQDRALADAIRETAATADELAFWKYQAIWGRAYLLQPSIIKQPFMEEGSVWKEATQQLEAARIAENQERYGND